MVLDQLKFYTKCHKSKCFRVITCPLKYYQDQNLLIWLCHRNNNTYDF